MLKVLLGAAALAAVIVVVVGLTPTQPSTNDNRSWPTLAEAMNATPPCTYGVAPVSLDGRYRCV